MPQVWRVVGMMSRTRGSCGRAGCVRRGCGRGQERDYMMTLLLAAVGSSLDPGRGHIPQPFGWEQHATAGRAASSEPLAGERKQEAEQIEA